MSLKNCNPEFCAGERSRVSAPFYLLVSIFWTCSVVNCHERRTKAQSWNAQPISLRAPRPAWQWATEAERKACGNRHSDTNVSGKEKMSLEVRIVSEKPQSWIEFIFSFYSLKPQGKVSQGYFTEMHMAVSGFRAMAFVSAISPAHSVPHKKAKSCLANRQYKQCFRQISEPINQYANI